MFAEDNEALDYERDIIFIYKKAVEYADDLFLGTEKLDKVVERLAAKISAYDYGELNPIYADAALLNISTVVAGAALNDLTDVTITNVQDNQLLRYNSVTGQWINVGPGSAVRNSQAFTATAGQTVFTTSFPFDAGLFDLYLNGVKLNSSSYTTFGEYQITLNDACLVGDIVDVVIFDPNTSILPSVNSLDDLVDVSLGALVNNQVLYYNSATGLWQNGTVSGGVWGTITGTLSNQTDLQNALNAKVPYTGATGDVNLGTHRILAQNATIASSGSGDTVTLNHSSGSGIGLNITKGGNGEGLYINKTSGSGNAATIIGTINATTLVKSGGTSSQFLKADGTVDSSVYVPTSRELTINGVTYDLSANRSWTVSTGISGSGASGQVAYWTGTTSQAGSNNLFWDNANGRLGVGTNTPDKRLHIKGDSTSSDIVFETNTYTTKGYFAHYQGATLQLAINRRIDGVFSNTGAASASINIVGLSGRGEISFFATNTNNTNPNEIMRVYGTGNVLIQNGGTFTDGGQRLQVQGTTLLNGNVTLTAANGRYLGFEGIATGITVDFRFGDVNNRLALTHAERLSLESYHGLIVSNSNLGGVKYAALTVLARESSKPILQLSSSVNTYATMFYSGNLALQNGGTFTDSGERLQVTGNTKLTGNLTATGGATINGDITFGESATSTLSFYNHSWYWSIRNRATGGLEFRNITGVNALVFTLSEIRNITSASANGATFSHPFTPTSGTGIFNSVAITSTINQTGGANGITRGLYVNPTLTAAADWRSIEWSNNSGWGLYGAGTARNYLGGLLQLNQTASTYSERLQVNGSSRFIGLVRLGGSSQGASLYSYYNTAGTVDNTAVNLQFRNESTEAVSNGTWLFSGELASIASGGDGQIFNINKGVNPTSGSSNFTIFRISSTISQSGGANGITRGIYIAPSLSTPFDYRAIEWNNNTGWGLYGAGTANNYLGGNLLLGSTTSSGERLQVTGTMKVTGNMTIGTTAAASTITLPQTSGYTDFIVTNNATASTGIRFRNTAGTRAITIGGTNMDLSNPQGSISAQTISSQQITLGSPTNTSIRGFNLATLDLAGNDTQLYARTNVQSVLRLLSGSLTSTAKGTVYISDYTNVAVSPNASAQLQVDSTVQGFLPPRGTNAQMLAIATPATGLVFYDTTNNKLNCYDGTNWQPCW
jgi:hypothetical protein